VDKIGFIEPGKLIIVTWGKIMKSKPKNEVRWGSIGCGDVMEVKSGPALSLTPGSMLQAVMRRDAALAKDFALRHHVDSWYANAQQLVNDPSVNAIYIATPPDSHLEYTRLAAAAGKPIYVEKPMANSFEECQEMNHICDTHQVPLFVAYYRRALPAYLKVKELLNQEAVGKILTVDMQLRHHPKPLDISGGYNWRVNPEIAGCGYFCDLASHMFDLLQFLLGDITQVSGTTANTGNHYLAEDRVEAVFEHANGIKGTGLWDFNSREEFDRTKIIGEQGSISYSHFIHQPVTMERSSGAVHYDLRHPEHIQRPLIELIVNELRGGQPSPSTGKTAAQTNWVMDRVLGRH